MDEDAAMEQFDKAALHVKRPRLRSQPPQPSSSHSSVFEEDFTLTSKHDADQKTGTVNTVRCTGDRGLATREDT